MAVEARHLSLFPPQFIGGREIMNPIEVNANMYNSNNNTANNQMGYGVPLSGITTVDSLLPAYNSVIVDSFPPKATAAPMKSDSGLTYNIPLTRKRPRESVTINPFFSNPTVQTPKTTCGSFSFLGEDISLHIQQQQLDIDRLISEHMEKVRLELEEKRKSQARRIIEAIEVGMMKRLRAKEEEIEKIGKLNWVLEEKVKSLCIENQIWRDLAQSNEAEANALRSNLEQVLAHVKDERAVLEEPTTADDAESCCGSNGGEEHDEEGDNRNLKKICYGDEGGRGGSSRWCRNCGKEESCVLLLPCRHLCLCTVCGSSLHVCPICKSAKNASVHVNLS